MPRLFFCFNLRIGRIGNGKKVTSIKILQNNEEKEIALEGVFIEIGSIPSTDFDNLTKKDQWKEIIIYEADLISNQTSVPGIFAAGDVTSVPEKQAIVAAGEGVKAILGIVKFLHK